jgi:uncharacterized membrane protein (DUF485 family)
MSNQDTDTTLSIESVSNLRSTSEFNELRRKSRRFTFVAGAVAWVYVLLLFFAVGYAPKLMAVPVFGPVNLGFLFVWSQVVVALVIAVMFMRHAAANQSLIAKMRGTTAEGEK